VSTLGKVEAVDKAGVYVVTPDARGVVRGPLRSLQTVAAGMDVLVDTTTDGDLIVVGPLRGGGGAFNVKAFGAVGDGVADDTEALQSAIDAAVAALGGRVLIPAGNYRTTSTLYIRERVTIEGALGALNYGNSAITLDTSDDIVALHIGRESSTEIWDVRIYGLSVARKTFDVTDGDLNTSGTGIYMDHVSEGRFVEVSAAGFRTGWDFNTVSICEFDYCKAYYCKYGLWFGITSPTGSGSRPQSVAVALRSWNLWKNGTGVLLGGAGTQLQFEGCHIEDCSVATFSVPAAATPIEAWGVAVRGCNLRNYESGARILAMVAPTSPSELHVYQFNIEDSLLQVSGCTSAIDISGAGGGYQSVKIGLKDSYVRGCSTAVASGSTALTLRYSGEILAKTGSDGTGSAIPLVTGSAVARLALEGVGVPTITGAKGGNAALGSLLTELAGLGLIIDSTT
jgi:hypothetical protein